MSNTIQDKTKARADKVKKKPYEKPAILYRAPLEALAAACPPPNGKSSGQPGCSTTFS